MEANVPSGNHGEICRDGVPIWEKGTTEAVPYCLDFLRASVSLR